MFFSSILFIFKFFFLGFFLLAGRFWPTSAVDRDEAKHLIVFHPFLLLPFIYFFSLSRDSGRLYTIQSAMIASPRKSGSAFLAVHDFVCVFLQVNRLGNASGKNYQVDRVRWKKPSGIEPGYRECTHITQLINDVYLKDDLRNKWQAQFAARQQQNKSNYPRTNVLFLINLMKCDSCLVVIEHANCNGSNQKWQTSLLLG